VRGGVHAVRALVVAALCVGVLAVAAPTAIADPEAVAQARQKAEAAAQALSDAETHLAELETEITTLQNQTTEARASLAGLQQEVETTAVQRYIAGELPDTVILSGADLGQQVQAEVLMRFLMLGDQDAVDRYRAINEDLDVATAALDEALADQQRTVASLQQQRTELEADLARLEELERQRLAEEARRREEAARQEAARLAAAAAAAVARPSMPTGGGGGGGGGVYPLQFCPVAGATTFVDSWGAPRSGGRRHQGVDMMAAMGTPVVAPVSGTVEDRGNALGGLSYHLNGDDGNYYYGTHLSAYGATGHVAAGTVIGYVGESGNAPVPHLHFEIHPYGGAAVNPTPSVRAVC
jgi:murein DD-endopeptidase MepM/ murein hydrolase activator NlpD